MDFPDFIAIFTEDGGISRDYAPSLEWKDVSVSGYPNIEVRAETSAVRFLRLHWRRGFRPETRFLGDAWERTYGDAQWRSADAARPMPWYFLADEGECVSAFGVKVRPGAFALWYAGPEGVTLWLDLRCGARGVRLAGRMLHAAEIVQARYEACTAWDAGCAFCHALCSDPLLPEFPIYGSNNWYYAYGNSTAESILRDAELLNELTNGFDNRPFMVIDDGWEQEYGGGCNAGPWNRSNPRHPDMAALAAGIRARGCRPGIWFRPLWDRDPAIPPEWKSRRDPEFLDPSVPEVLEHVRNDVRTLTAWGYELIKHDFSTADCFGRWGFEMFPWPASGDWAFADGGRTSAEIVGAFYRAILEGAGGRAVILGCNTVGHLGAGLMHAARSGDDTSGRCWERTRKMGVNTLAFRGMQHNAFFALDADCVGITREVPWERNREWLRLLALSGTALFVSVAPDALSAEARRELRRCLKLASAAETAAVPLDWQSDSCPRRWKVGETTASFHWYDPQGEPQEFA